MKTGIYKITNIINGKNYIGSSLDIDLRWRDHKKLLKSNKHHSNKLQNSYNKHGIDSFEYSILEYCNKDLLLIREQYWLDIIKPFYNILKFAGRTIGRVVPEETKEKLRIANTGKTMSDEAKKKMSESHKGIIPSDETRKKMSSWQKGKIVSEETKAKLRGPMKKGCNEETLRRQKVKGTGKKRGPYKKVIK